MVAANKHITWQYLQINEQLRSKQAHWNIKLASANRLISLIWYCQCTLIFKKLVPKVMQNSHLNILCQQILWCLGRQFFKHFSQNTQRPIFAIFSVCYALQWNILLWPLSTIISAGLVPVNIYTHIFILIRSFQISRIFLFNSPCFTALTRSSAQHLSI